RDHDIKVWDVEKEVVIRRLVGHTAPITGIKLQGADPKEACSADLTVISSSEDGSIREWSIRKGIEIRKIETENVITCMGIMQQSKLAAIGNHKGHLDVYHLSTGQLYSSIVAHNDPIDALMVNDVHICTAVYDRPGSLRVWQLKWGKAICMYSLEEMFSIEFTAFTLYGDLLILGDGTEQKLHILSYMDEDSTDTLQLSENAGYVQQVAVMDGLVLASTVDSNKMVHLHVYQQLALDHLGTFYCKNMDRISSIVLIRNHALKFILGGSALAVLKLETSPTEDITSTDSNSKSLKQTDVENETIQEIMDAKHTPYPEDDLLKDKDVDEAHKSQSSTSSTTVHCHQKQPTFESFSHLPPIVKSKESKLQLKKADLKCKHPESEYYWTKNAHLYNPDKQEGMLSHFNLQANFQEKTNSESTAPIDELNRLDLDSRKDQGDIQQPHDLAQEKQKDDFKGQPLSQHNKNFMGETSGNNGTEEHLSQRIPQTLTQKQKYESEKVRIVKINKHQEEGKKRSWFHLTKKKQQKCTEKAQQKKKKEKDCKIM
ncbi:hypothetical protein AVEN_104825-1, partial [Araneus ventricosus]